MLPSEITGPGPGATRADPYDLREQERRNRQADQERSRTDTPLQDRRRAGMFAGRLLAEGYGPDASDEEMTAAFAPCVRPCRPELYPAIRDEARALVASR